MKNIKTPHCELKRRQFISNIARSCLGVSCSGALANPVAAHPYASAKRVIYLYMSGGMSHLDTFDLKPKNPDVQGPTGNLKTTLPGYSISAFLPRTAKVMHHTTVINSMFSNQGSHVEGRYFMHSSYRKQGSIRHPGLGSWIVEMDGLHNPTLPGVIHIGTNNPGSSQGYLNQKAAPLTIGDPETGLQNSQMNSTLFHENFDETMGLIKHLNKRFSKHHQHSALQAYNETYDDALRLMKSRHLSVFDLSEEPEALRNAYGRNSFGQGCMLARRLAERDVRFIEVTLSDWDTHTNNFERVEENAEILDKAYSALMVDLHRRGLLEDTLVVLTTEFGRSPKINANEGRDHSPAAFSSVLAGGGISKGRVYGKTDKNGKAVSEDRVTVPDFNASIAYALGLPFEKPILSPSGRPFKLADKGQPIHTLFS